MKYSVVITETNYCYVDVVAANKDEALEKAKEEYERGSDDMLCSKEVEYRIGYSVDTD